MAKNNNLNDFLTDIANTIRTKKGTTAEINAQNFSSEIASITTGITPTGNINITNTNSTDVTNYATAKVVDGNLIASNIREGVNILGIDGTYDNGTDGISRSGNDVYYVSLNNKCFVFSGNNNNDVVCDGGNVYINTNGAGSFSATNLSADNIKQGVKILGKTGTFTSDANATASNIDNGKTAYVNGAKITGTSTKITPSGNINITNTNSTNVTNYATAKVVDANLVASNIKKDTTILGITGTYDNDTLKTLLDYSRRTYYIFRNNTYVTDLTPYFKFNTTSNVDNTGSMYYGCSNLLAVPLFDTSKVTYMANMFAYCSKITTIPAYNTSNTKDMSYMFYHCDALTTVPAIDTSKVTDMTSIFYKCFNLKTVLMTGMKVSFDISASTKFERSDLVTILNNLGTVSTSQTLTMGTTNLGKLTTEDKAIATTKGWTLA